MQEATMIDSNIRKIPTVLAAAGLAVALVLGFALNPTPTSAANPPHDHGGDDTDTSGGKIAVMATFRDGGGDLILSDCATAGGPCPYVDKVDNVRATLGSANGNLNLGIGKPKPKRGLVLDFSECEGTCAVQLLVDNGADLTIEDNGFRNQTRVKLTPYNYATGFTYSRSAAFNETTAQQPRTVELIQKLMLERGIPLPTVAHTVGGGDGSLRVTRVTDEDEDDN